MNKQEFLEALRAGLTDLQEQELEEYLNFYGEILDDRMEEAIPEDDAVAELGSIESVIAKIKETIQSAQAENESESASELFEESEDGGLDILEAGGENEMRVTTSVKKKKNAGDIALLAVGFPIWGSLLIAAFAVVFSLFVSAWSVIAALWAAFGAFALSSVGGIVIGFLNVFGEQLALGFSMIACAIVLAGLAIFAFFGCKWATVGMVIATKKTALWIAKCFRRKEKQR